VGITLSRRGRHRDALPTHAGAAEFLVAGKQAHFLSQIKAKQPTLLTRCTGLPWHRVPVWTAPATALEDVGKVVTTGT
jgi:hypothetical protein